MKYQGYKAHVTKRVNEFVEEGEAVNDTQTNENYCDENSVQNNLLQMRLLNTEMKALSAKFDALCKASENALNKGNGDTNYSVDRSYHDKELKRLNNTMNKLSKYDDED